MASDDSIRRNIRALRLSLGYSQERMGRELGLSRTSYRKLESGPTAIINPAVYKLSEIASIAVEEILGGNLQSGSTDGCSTLAEERNRELELAELRRYYEDLLKSRDERIAELRASVQEKMDVINSQKGIIAFLERHTDF